MFLLVVLSTVAALTRAAYLDPFNTRIVGGRPAENEWPWQVSLQSRLFSLLPWSHSCGGSIIAENYILTAAHCVDGQSKSNLRIVAGVNKLSSASSANRFSVAEIIKHPAYNGNADGFPNDIALLKLSSPITTNENVMVTLAEPTSSFVGNSDCWITGWGKTSANSATTDDLMEAKMDVITNSQCKTEWSSIVSGESINDGHICVFTKDKSACNGDSGGPLVCKDEAKGKYILAGATSWGITTCEGYPSVYARVGYFANWIRDNMSSN